MYCTGEGYTPSFADVHSTISRRIAYLFETSADQVCIELCTDVTNTDVDIICKLPYQSIKKIGGDTLYLLWMSCNTLDVTIWAFFQIKATFRLGSIGE